MFLIQHRRRRERKTNYKKRLGMLKSRKTRVVVRRSLSGIMIQFIEYIPSGDKTLLTTVSNELAEHGWKGSTGNVPAAYLTGYLAGMKAKKADIKEGIFDTGLQRLTKGSRIFAALKGLVDAGIQIPHSPEVLPSDDRIKGKHILEYAKKLSSEEHKKMFSKYISAGLKPEEIERYFADAKNSISKV